MIVVSHLTGNANVKAAAQGFLEARLLAELHVSLATFPNGLLSYLGTFDSLSDIRRRQFIPELRPHMRTWPWLELGRILAPRIGFGRLTDGENAPFEINAVVRGHDRRVATQLAKATRRGANAVYGYEDTVLFAFREAKKLGLKCLYDLPIGYWRAAHRLLEAERERWPEWAITLTGLYDTAEKLARKEEELQLADAIFVASTFTANTLAEFPGALAPVHVIPYGFPPVSTAPALLPTPAHRRPLKLLFVGSLSQRKGIADLFAAVANLQPHVTLTVVGSKASDSCPALDASLARHRWIPSLSHPEVLEQMRAHDVLVFPSLFEGFGLVITEAMSQGTPVITTDRTAGPDLIRHGENGWLIQAGSTEALQAALEELLARPQAIAEIGAEARNAARRRPWTMYGQELAAAVGPLL